MERLWAMRGRLLDLLRSLPARPSCWVAYDCNSGRMIIQILERNPKKDPEQYDGEDTPHMRKVVAYCKRHMAQEAKGPAKNPESKSCKYREPRGYMYSPV